MVKDVQYNWIWFGINKQMLQTVINPKFKEFTGLTLTNFLLNEGYSPVMNEISMRDDTQVFYNIRRVDAQFMQFVASFKEAFTFKSVNLAWVKNVTYEEKQMLIPDYFPRAKGRTFEQALILDIDKPKQYEGNDVYPCFFYDHQNEDGTYGSTAIENNQDDFWAFYKFFGADRIILDYKIRENAAN